MMPPPPQGDPMELVPPNMTNPEAWAMVVSWDAWRVFGGQVIDDALAELQGSGGILA
jgi:hypothetical protein